MSTDTSFEGDLLDPSKCSKLSVEEKRELVHQVSKWPNGAAEALHAWSRQDILQVLCAEMGKERKYTGLTKLKIIEQLLKIISEKKSGAAEATAEQEQQSSPSPRSLKRQRKAENPSRLPLTSSFVPIATAGGGGDAGTTVYCKNSACKAILSRGDRFCKRCSCCICFRYDDNKDPSVWLICSSEPPSHGDSCGMSCHLECALKHEQSGIAIDGRHRGVDGCFSCVSCGKVNDLLGCWRKQLIKAIETRRVDILCYRVALSKKLLKGTEKYRKCYEIVDEAVKKLEADVGPLTGLPAKIGRGIVNRLSTGPEVQKLCAYAMDALDSMLSLTDSHAPPIPMRQGSTLIVSDMVRFENISNTSLTVMLCCEDHSPDDSLQYTLWHRKSYDAQYPEEATCILAPNKRFIVSGLNPDTEYSFKVAAFNGTSLSGTCEVRALTSAGADEASDHSVAERSQSPATNCSSLSNPSSVEDESNNISMYDTKMNSQSMKDLSYVKDSEKLVPDSAVDGTGLHQEVGLNEVPLLEENHDIRITGSLPHIPNEENKHAQEDRMEAMNIDNGSNIHARANMECVPFGGSLESALPITPCKLETSRDGPGRIGRLKPSIRDLEIGNGKGDGLQDGSTSKKRSSESRDEECEANAHSDRDFEYYVKKIRWLECEGHIEKNFRQKFLTWYSLRATPQEVRVVKVFIDTLIGDPMSLAEQLIDAFSDCISSKASSVVPSGFCMKLWH